MSALMTPRRSRRTRRDAARRPQAQSSLFAAAAAAAEAPEAAAAPVEATAVPETFEAPAPAQAAAVPETFEAPVPAGAAGGPETFTTAGARRQGPTLDDLVAGAWEGLLAGAPADCLVCGTQLAPRHSAGAGIVGGRCGGCGSTLG